MTDGQGDAKGETPEQRMARIQEELERKRKAQAERLAAVEDLVVEKRRRAEAQEASAAGQAAAQAGPPTGGAGSERLATLEAKLREKREREERIRRLERIAAMEQRMARSGAEVTPSGAGPALTPPAPHVRARGARVGSLVFYVLLAAGVVLLIPDLLKDLAGVDVLSGLASNNSTSVLAQPVLQMGDASVTLLGFLGIVLVVAAMVVLAVMLVVYRRR